MPPYKQVGSVEIPVVIGHFKEGEDYLNARRHPAFQALIKELESTPEPASPREK